MTDEKSLTFKICSICGLKKPISDFLQFVSAEGAAYGNICASCRKIQKRAGKFGDDASSTRSGFLIDSKARLKGETDKRDFRQKIKDANLETKKKQEEKKIKQDEKSTVKEKVEKLYRKEYLEKRSFIGTTPKVATRATVARTTLPQNREALKAQPAIDQEIKERARRSEGGVDVSTATPDTQFGTTEKLRSSEILKQFLDWFQPTYFNSVVRKPATKESVKKIVQEDLTPPEPGNRKKF